MWATWRLASSASTASNGAAGSNPSPETRAGITAVIDGVSTDVSVAGTDCTASSPTLPKRTAPEVSDPYVANGHRIGNPRSVSRSNAAPASSNGTATWSRRVISWLDICSPDLKEHRPTSVLFGQSGYATRAHVDGGLGPCRGSHLVRPMPDQRGCRDRCCGGCGRHPSPTSDGNGPAASTASLRPR